MIWADKETVYRAELMAGTSVFGINWYLLDGYQSTRYNGLPAELRFVLSPGNESETQYYWLKFAIDDKIYATSNKYAKEIIINAEALAALKQKHKNKMKPLVHRNYIPLTEPEKTRQVLCCG
jgi:hypothetical protein